MSLEKDLIIGMSYISNKKPIPVRVAKTLIAELCKYRAKAQWLQSVVTDLLTESYEASRKAEELMDTVHGTFDEKDDIFLQAYVACTDKQIPGEKLTKESLVVVKGDKE